MAATLFFVRHAHAVWQPDEQQRLSARGRAEADRVAERLAALPLTAIYASPYPRAVETVEPLARRRGLPVVIEDDLRERRLSGGRLPEDGAGPEEAFRQAVRWAWEHPDESMPGGETNRAAGDRGCTVVERLRAAHPGERIVLGTHGSLMALLFHRFDPTFTFAGWERMTRPDVYRLGPSGRVERLWEAE